MDNFEHLLAGVDLLVELLATAPQLRMLVTSREVLNVREEWLYQVEGMSYPQHLSSDAEDGHAVQLFVERARQVRKNFVLEDERNNVIRVVRLVEGMPLPIELAAAWLKTLSCAEIADEIQRNVEFLASSLRDIPARHRSMHAVFEHSWRMLAPHEQNLFMKLVIFRNGCTRQAAEAVTGASLSTLSTLVDKSFIRRTAAHRYEIHELMRQYGEDHLKASGMEASARDAHSQYYLSALAQREADIKGRRQLAALDEIEVDFENIRAAWEWAAETRNVALIDDALECLFWFCVSRNRLYESALLFQMALQHQPSKTGRLRAYHSATLVMRYMGDDDALTQLQESLAIAQKVDDHATLAFCLLSQGEAAIQAHQYSQALTFFRQALNLYQSMDDRFYMGRTLGFISICEFLQLDVKAGRDAARQGLENARSIGDKIGMAICLYRLGGGAGFVGDFSEHKAVYWETLDIRREMGDKAGIALNLGGLAYIEFHAGNFASAKELASEAFAIASDLNHLESKCQAMNWLGHVALMEGNEREARQLLEGSLALASDPAKVGSAEIGLAMMACAQGEFGLARIHLQNAHYLFIKDALKFITPCILVMALIRIDEGQSTHGIKIISFLEHLPHPVVGFIKAWRLISGIKADLKADLGTEAYALAWEHGKALELAVLVEQLIEGFAADHAPALLSDQMVAANQALISPLTQREHEILLLIAQGLSNRQIAEQLVIAVSTVKRHVNNCYGKLDVSSRTQAVIKAQNLKLV
jgi:predicted ATPase/DNA-binding CsgD family transcriptional regulator